MVEFQGINPDFIFHVGETNEVQDAVSTLKAALVVVPIGDVPRPALVKLKESCETSGQRFPFSIPEQVRISRASCVPKIVVC